MNQNKRKNAVNVYRVSSEKQFQTGDSFEEQKKQCYTVNNQCGHNRIKEFSLVETGADKDRQDFQKVLDFCKDPANKVEVLVIKSIDRLTRGGDVVYGLLKKELAGHGIEIVDANGFIQPTKNSLEHLNVHYEWGDFSVSENAEAMEANRAKQERRDILTRVIGAEIIYTRQGYAVRGAPFGLINDKIETVHGKRTIRIPHVIESQWIKVMFEMRAEGLKSDEQIVAEINKSGFKTRLHKVRDRATRMVAGTRGGKPLTVKQMQRFIRKPIYAGYIVEKWTEGQPIKAKFSGLVSVETFNKANRGKVVIVEDDIAPKILYNQSPIRRLRYNPKYPFKQVKCPICNKELSASAPRNGSGKPSPRYHCARGHKYWDMRQDIFESTIYEFIKDLKFSDEFLQLFREVVLNVWQQKRHDALEQAQVRGRRVLELEAQKQSLIQTMMSLTSPDAIKAFEDKLESVGIELALVKQERNDQEKKEVDIEEVVHYATYLMERPEVLLIDTDNSEQQRTLFRLVFDEMPNYDEIINGTARLSRTFGLKSQQSLSKSQLVTPPGVEPGFLG